MKIVDLAEFLKQPEGTVFSKYEPCVFGDICVKGKSHENDFYYQPLNGAIKADSITNFYDNLAYIEVNKTEIELDFNHPFIERTFNKDEQRFAVWSKEDVLQLAKRLELALIEGYLLVR
jgi:hypothetical protein